VPADRKEGMRSRSYCDSVSPLGSVDSNSSESDIDPLMTGSDLRYCHRVEGSLTGV
jgi:hypothetical protein